MPAGQQNMASRHQTDGFRPICLHWRCVGVLQRRKQGNMLQLRLWGLHSTMVQFLVFNDLWILSVSQNVHNQQFLLLHCTQAEALRSAQNESDWGVSRKVRFWYSLPLAGNVGRRGWGLETNMVAARNRAGFLFDKPAVGWLLRLMFAFVQTLWNVSSQHHFCSAVVASLSLNVPFRSKSGFDM